MPLTNIVMTPRMDMGSNTETRVFIPKIAGEIARLLLVVKLIIVIVPNDQRLEVSTSTLKTSSQVRRSMAVADDG